MNGTANMNGYRAYTGAYAGEERTPLILVLFARIVLWLTNAETVRNIKCTCAVISVMIVAVIAGAIGIGAIPLFLGAVTAFAFGGLGVLLTFDLN